MDEQIKKYSAKRYDELLPLLDAEPDTYEIDLDSDRCYQFEVMAFWNDKKEGDLQITVSIDNGGRSAYHPLTKSFVKKKPKKS